MGAYSWSSYIGGYSKRIELLSGFFLLSCCYLAVVYFLNVCWLLILDEMLISNLTEDCYFIGRTLLFHR